MTIQQLNNKLQSYIWSPQENVSFITRQIILLLKIASLVVRDLLAGLLSLRAMSLVYTTLLSLVPLLAVSFSVLKGFGVHNQIEPMLTNLLLPLGDKGPEITEKIISFVENMKMGVLGGVGMVFLIYTVISLISKIEAAFNFTWHISSVRSPTSRFSNYLSIVMIGPVMIFAAIGISASLSSNTVIDYLNQFEVVGQLISIIANILPLLMIIGAFTFIYIFVPNTKVTFKSALYGAIFSGIIWELLGSAFASFASGSTSYTAIYSGFAILILFMIWLYLGWLILLTGANIAYYHQHPERLKWDLQKHQLSGRIKEQSMLQIMLFIARKHAQKTEQTVTMPFLANQLDMPDETLTPIVDALQKSGFIKTSNDEPKQFIPAKSIELISVSDVINCARQNLESEKQAQDFPMDDSVQRIMESHQLLIEEHFNKTKLSNLIEKS